MFGAEWLDTHELFRRIIRWSFTGIGLIVSFPLYHGPVTKLQITAFWPRHDPFSEWECSLQWKPRSHWLKVLRQRHTAVLMQGPVKYSC